MLAVTIDNREIRSGTREHAFDARLVADAPAELTHAFLAGVGLGGH